MQKEKIERLSFFLFSSLLFYFVLITSFYFLSTLLKLNENKANLEYSFSKNYKLNKYEIKNIQCNFSYNEKTREKIYFDTKGEEVYSIHGKLDIFRLFNDYYFIKNNFYSVGIKVGNSIYFINIFSGILRYLKIFILLFPLLLFFTFAFSTKIIKLEDRKKAVQILNNEIELNNKILFSLIENFNHKFNTPFEIIEYISSKEKLNTKDVKILKEALDEFKSFNNKISKLKENFDTTTKCFHSLILKGFSLAFYQNLMYESKLNVDKKLMEYYPKENKADNLIIIIFFKIAEELSKLNYFNIKVVIKDFKKNHLSMFIFEVDSYKLDSFDKSLLEKLLELLDGTIDIKNDKLLIKIPAEKHLMLE